VEKCRCALSYRVESNPVLNTKDSREFKRECSASKLCRAEGVHTCTFDGESGTQAVNQRDVIENGDSHAA
jgi:hypothetical protein